MQLHIKIILYMELNEFCIKSKIRGTALGGKYSCIIYVNYSHYN